MKRVKGFCFRKAECESGIPEKNKENFTDHDQRNKIMTKKQEAVKVG